MGFHLRHIAGSVDRLTTYLEGRPLDQALIDALAAEMEPGAGRSMNCWRTWTAALPRAEQTIRGIDPATFTEPRWVGRKRLPTTVIGLVVHIAEHTQRHLGQAIAAAQLARTA